MRPSSCRLRLDSGMRCAPLPDWRTRAAGPATCRSRLSTGACSRPTHTPLAERRDLDDERRAASRRGAVDASRARSRRQRAHRVSRSRRRAARRRLRDAAGLRAAGRPRIGVASHRLRRPQGDRDVLHTAADRGLPGPAHARSARATTPRRIASSSFASSIRRWAAARFWSPPAGFSPVRTNRRSFVTVVAIRATSASPSASASGGRLRNAAFTAWT